jgi:sodium transport system permease protein
MRLNIIKIVFRKELREMLRDRRSLAIMFGIPLVLYPALTIMISKVGVSKQKELKERPAAVAVVNADQAPHLEELFKSPKSGISLQKSSNPTADLSSGKLDAIVEVPQGAETTALKGAEADFITRVDRSRTTSAVAANKLDRIFDKYERWIIEQRLREHGQSVDLLKPIKHTTDDVATADQRFGKMLALALPVLLLMTGMLGALFPALNATTTERELGTLETLLVTPAGRMELLIAKGALVLLSSLLTSGLNMLSMSLVLWRVLSQESELGNLKISMGALMISYLAAVPTLITFATLVLIIGLLARNFREANSLATPVMLIPLGSMLVGILEPAMSPGLLVTPVANTTIIIREALTSRVSVGPFVLAFISSCVYAGMLLSAAARVFTNEQLVNPAWEPVSLAGFSSARRRNRPRRLPAVDEALALFAATLLLSFYIQPSLLKYGLVPLLLISQILLFAAPALLLAWAGRYKWIETFSWRKPSAAAVVGGIFLGIGLAPWMQFVGNLQEKIWQPNHEQQEQLLKLVAGPLEHHPILIPIVVGILAGICEETLFRGPILAGLRRRLSTWPAILITALLFAAAHLDLFGLPIRIFLGILLGWIVVAAGSIIPAMLMHACYDIVQLFMAAAALRAPQPQQNEHASVWMLAIGAICIGAATTLLRRARRSRESLAIQLSQPQAIS